MVLLELRAAVLRPIGNSLSSSEDEAKAKESRVEKGREWNIPDDIIIGPGSRHTDPQTLSFRDSSGSPVMKSLGWEGNDIYFLFFHYKHTNAYAIPARVDMQTLQMGHSQGWDRIKLPKRAKTGDKSLNKFIMRRLWLLRGCKQAKGWAQKKFSLMTNLKERQRSSGKLSWQPHRQVDITLPASKCFQCLFSESLEGPLGTDRTGYYYPHFTDEQADVWHCDIFRLWVWGWSSFHDLKPFPKPKFVF